MEVCIMQTAKIIWLLGMEDKSMNVILENLLIVRKSLGIKVKVD